MYVSQDYENLFKILNAYQIKYLVVGAYAVIHYAQPRYTKDIDVWIIPELNDAQEIYKALREFGAPLKNIKPDDVTDKEMVFQIGMAPVRIDIMMSVSGVSFKDAWPRRKRLNMGKHRYIC